MKTVNLIRYLNTQNCYLHREGSNHSVFVNQLNKNVSSAPKHKETKNNLVRKICKEPEIPTLNSFQ